MRDCYVFGTDDGWNYQIIKLPSLGKVLLWYQVPGQPWEIGHSKEIPDGWGFNRTAGTMHQFMVGIIDHEEYNTILPR